MKLTILTLALLCVLGGNLANDDFDDHVVALQERGIPFMSVPCKFFKALADTKIPLIKQVGKAFHKLLCREKGKSDGTTKEGGGSNPEQSGSNPEQSGKSLTVYIAYGKDSDIYVGLFDQKDGEVPVYKQRSVSKVGNQIRSLASTKTNLYLAFNDIGYFTRDQSTGELSAGGIVVVGSSSFVNFIALHSSNKFLLASVTGNTKGSVVALPIKDDGVPDISGMKIYDTLSLTSTGPAALAFNPNFKNLLAVVYGDLRKVAFYDFNSDNGAATLTAFVEEMPAGIKPTDIQFNKLGNFMYVAGSSKIIHYELEFDFAARLLKKVNRKLTIDTVKPIVATLEDNQLVFNPTKNIIYAINKIAGSIAVFTYSRSTGVLTARGEVIPIGTKQYYEMAVSPDGKYLLVSSYSGDELVVFSLENPYLPTLKPDSKLTLNSATAILF